jgi:hypothetical protein
MARARSSKVLVELDGPGVSPKNVDAVTLLRLAEAYFVLLTKLADAKGKGLSLTGLAVLDKCVALESKSSDAYVARFFGEMAVRIVSGKEVPPFGLEGVLNDVRTALRSLPATHVAKVRAGGARARRLRLPKDAELGSYAWETLALRSTVVRVGGRDPRAQFLSASEATSFTLSVTTEEARSLGAKLYLPLELEARVLRDEEGRISQGAVVRFTVLDDRDPADAWREWFADIASDWAEVDDVNAELGRHAG